MSARSIDGIIPRSNKKVAVNVKNKHFGLEKLLLLSKRMQFILSTLLLVILFLIIIAFSNRDSSSPDPISLSIRQSVNFNLYYPDSGKLPSGYTFDIQSVSASHNAVIFTIKYGHSSQIVFSEQPLPSSTELQTFYAQRIPLRNEIKTPLGEAAISSLNNRAFVSLPIHKTWIILTALNNINQNQLKQVLLSLKQAQ
jgi:hypothetical protein